MFAFKDFHGTRGYAGSVESSSPEALKFMALIQPWIRIAGSALDVEEAMAQLDLPTSYRGWVTMSRPEKQLALSVARMFNALARTAFANTSPANEVTHIVPSLGAFVSADRAADAPLQFAINVKDGSARDAVEIEFTTTPLAYAGLSSPGAMDIATLNAAIRTAGLLEEGEDAVEVGNMRIVVRKEVAEHLLSASLLSSAARNSIPWLSGIEVQAYAKQADVTLNTGTVLEDMVLYNADDSTRSIVVSRFIAGAPDTIRIKSITGTAPGITDDYLSGDQTVWVTFDSVVTTEDILAAPLEIANGDPNDADSSANGTPYPFISAVVTSTLLADSAAVGYAFARGVADAGTAGGAQDYDRPAIREDSRGRLEYGMNVLAAEYELVARGDITGTASTWLAIKALLRTQGLYASAQEAMSGALRVTMAYVSGNGTAPIVGEIASFGNVRATVERVDGNGTSGEVDLTVFLGLIEANDTGTMTTSGGHSSTATAANPTYGLPAFIGSPSTISGAGDIAGMTPIGELNPRLVHLTATHLMLLGGGGSDLIALGDDIHLPSVENLIMNPRHLFQTMAQAWLEKIDIDNAADPVTYANDSSALQYLGWPSWCSGTALERAEGLLSVDPALWERYLLDVALVASGESMRPIFRVRSSAAGRVLGQSVSLSPGEIGLTPVTPVDGHNEAKFTLQFRVPPHLPANVGTGGVLIELPEGMATFVGADFMSPEPNVGSFSTLGRSVLTILFDDLGVTGYAAGSLVSLAELTLRAGVVHAGDPGRGMAMKISPFGTWVDMASSLNYISHFRGVRLSIITELP